MKFWKILLSAVLCLALSLAFLPATASAATVNGSCGDNLTWTLADDGTLTISGTGPMTDYDYNADVPWDNFSPDRMVVGAGVTELCEKALWNYPDGYWVDPANAHYSSDASGVLFNKNKSTLFATAGDMDGHYTVPDTVRTIEAHAFNSSFITTVTLPDGLEIIGERAFSNCQDLTTVTIPRCVYSIGTSPFSPSYALDGIWVDEDNLNFSSDSSGVLFNKDKTILLSAPNSLSGHYDVPDTVRIIDQQAFNCCDKITSINIPKSVTRIEELAFMHCSRLTTIIGCKGITDIGNSAFSLCSALSDVYYDGTAFQAAAIRIGPNNDCLLHATMHFAPWVVGDMDGDGDKDSDDAVYLLLNVMFGDEDYPLPI